MTLVAATYTVTLRYTRTMGGELYFSTTAVCITEVMKLCISMSILAKETRSLRGMMASLRDNVLRSPKEMLKLSVPSLVYAIQNNMAFLALSNLDAAVYQVTYQLKIPCTALCTVLMLHRSLSKLQWISVFMLCGGVTLVQWNPAETTKVQLEQNPVIGFVALTIAVLCSGFAVLASMGGLYTSVVVKYTDNIMKGFSAAAAIVLSTVASVMLFGLQITLTFILGTLLVCISIYLYGLPKQDTTQIQPAESDQSVKERLITV
ncbi:CMP-sialic acid transporter isoform X2 [Microcaecilia unicolor]|uniref:CMP-sialic acid transporter isoform X2 n=1 Tax=Microcaecilia unicolor TaxID=1415580 RepID=A0A6P7WTG9_9AMPH|nr:CMP-sialic acid transporter isoform X2 [Microcaecilia unicolor]